MVLLIYLEISFFSTLVLLSWNLGAVTRSFFLQFVSRLYKKYIYIFDEEKGWLAITKASTAGRSGGKETLVVLTSSCATNPRGW